MRVILVARAWEAFVVCVIWQCAATLRISAAAETENATLLCEEAVTTVAPANNGAGPLWCYGSPLVVRQGETVSLAIIEAGQNVPPLCNTRWQLWQRAAGGWRVVAEEAAYREREPCPLVALSERDLLLSANPSTEPPGTQYGPCRPLAIRLSHRGGEWTQMEESPAWSDSAYFTDHSYRGLAADIGRGEVLLLNIDARTSAQHISHRDHRGMWRSRGQIAFPIRAAYPQVALREGAAHVLAIGDIQEPVDAWRKLKFQNLRSEWDYVFRRLFYTFTPDIDSEPFTAPLEIDTVEDTAGHITNLDLHVDAGGKAHVLYLKRPHVHAFIRDQYFPGAPMTQTLEYANLVGGNLTQKRMIGLLPANGEGFEPTYGRFHVGPDERLYVVAAGTRTIPHNGGVFVNRVFPVEAPGDSFELPLNRPLRVFFTNTPRGGSRPSNDLDLFGIADDASMLRYAHLRLTFD